MQRSPLATGEHASHQARPQDRRWAFRRPRHKALREGWETELHLPILLNITTREGLSNPDRL